MIIPIIPSCILPVNPMIPPKLIPTKIGIAEARGVVNAVYSSDISKIAIEPNNDPNKLPPMVEARIFVNDVISSFEFITVSLLLLGLSLIILLSTFSLFLFVSSSPLLTTATSLIEFSAALSAFSASRRTSFISISLKISSPLLTTATSIEFSAALSAFSASRRTSLISICLKISSPLLILLLLSVIDTILTMLFSLLGM
mmetsp:Transcript_40668/g.41240  ORF Transcript_40668/g.41240 Transcript_40668/m.41240 type:complete len:200 (+) Transcript_40668:532-1131(+)